jgi:hypothetical protein
MIFLLRYRFMLPSVNLIFLLMSCSHADKAKQCRSNDEPTPRSRCVAQERDAISGSVCSGVDLSISLLVQHGIWDYGRLMFVQHSADGIGHHVFVHWIESQGVTKDRCVSTKEIDIPEGSRLAMVQAFGDGVASVGKMVLVLDNVETLQGQHVKCRVAMDFSQPGQVIEIEHTCHPSADPGVRQARPGGEE